MVDRQRKETGIPLPGVTPIPAVLQTAGAGYSPSDERRRTRCFRAEPPPGESETISLCTAPVEPLSSSCALAIIQLFDEPIHRPCGRVFSPKGGSLLLPVGREN